MSSRNILVDVVIPVFGQPEILAECLKAIEPQTQELANVLLFDDCSPDQKAMEAVYAGRKVYRSKQNVGFGATCNRVLDKGKAPLILFLNSDVLLQPNALDNLIKELDDPQVGAAGPLLTFPQGSRWGNAGKVQHAGMVFDIAGKPFHIHLGWNPNHPRVTYRKELQCITGACILTRRSLFVRAGGFDYKYYGRGTYEDVDYCLKLRTQGLKVVFTPGARGIHHTGASIVGSKSAFPIAENHKKFIARWGKVLLWDEYKFW